MFGFGPQFHMHHHCMTNPFGAGFAANPKINFCLGLAAATSGMPVFSQMPMAGFGMTMPLFSTQMPAFGMSMNGSLFATPYPTNFGAFGMMPNSVPNYDFNNFKYDPNAFNYDPNTVSGAGGTYNSPFSNIGQFKFNFSYTPSSSSSTDNSADSSNPTGQKVSLNSADYGPEFLEKVKQIAKRLNCNYRDLLGLMNSESGINSKAVNKNGGATGLIQFMPATAKGLGTSTAALKNMSPIEQLDYVEKCIANSKSAAGFGPNDKLSAGDLYALVFLPARAKRDVLTQSGENYYSSNTGLDLNKDGKITKEELSQRVKNKYVSDNSFLA